MGKIFEVGRIYFWSNYSTFGVCIDPDFWAKEAGYKPEKGKVPLLLMGSLMLLKFSISSINNPSPKVKHSRLTFSVHPADLINFGSAKDLIMFCTCAVCFAGQRDREYLSAVTEEAKALAGEKECIPALANFFAKAVLSNAKI